MFVWKDEKDAGNGPFKKASIQSATRTLESAKEVFFTFKQQEFKLKNCGQSYKQFTSLES